MSAFFAMIFMPFFVGAMVTVGILIGLKRRAILRQQQALRDQQRFLKNGFLRTLREQENFQENFLEQVPSRKGAG